MLAHLRQLTNLWRVLCQTALHLEPGLGTIYNCQTQKGAGVNDRIRLLIYSLSRQKFD